MYFSPSQDVFYFDTDLFFPSTSPKFYDVTIDFLTKQYFLFHLEMDIMFYRVFSNKPQNHSQKHSYKINPVHITCKWHQQKSALSPLSEWNLGREKNIGIWNCIKSWLYFERTLVIPSPLAQYFFMFMSILLEESTKTLLFFKHYATTMF